MNHTWTKRIPTIPSNRRHDIMQNILFSIDSPLPTSTPTNPYIEFRGWTFSKTSEIKQIRITYNEKSVEAKFFMSRHDVAVAFPDFAAKAKTSGFYKLIPLSKEELLSGILFTIEITTDDGEVCTQQIVILPVSEQQYENMKDDDSVCTCSFCGETSHFGDSGFDYPIFHKYKIIGAGIRPKTACQFCGSNDRIRYLDYVLSNYTNIYRSKNRILHIAPEKLIEKKIRSNKKCDYITGDIQEGVADCKVDVTRMQFPEKHFDFIMLNHVFEHIPDEAAAVSEIKRCLKKNGKLIFSVPICLERNSFEDSSYTTAEDRIKFFGQADHVRLYGANDIVARFERYGLKVTEYIAEKVLSAEQIAKMRVSAQDRIFVAKKNNTIVQPIQSFKTLWNEIREMKFELEKTKNMVKNLTDSINEANWAHIFHDTISTSPWLQDKSFSPGRMSLGYNGLYVLYRILNEFKPQRILEIGLGQSTHMISQFVKYANAEHIVVEANKDWIDFYKNAHSLPEGTQIKHLDYEIEPYKNEQVRVFKNFKESLSGKKFDFILVDAPFGADMIEYSRIDILQLIPDSLAKDFVIFIDDTQRYGESHTSDSIVAKLAKNGISVCKGRYSGVASNDVICSENLRFLTTL